jgi:hypothetical protein
VLGRSPGENSQVEVMNELVAKFRRWKELCSCLEGPGTKICAMLIGPPANEARWPHRFDKAAEWLEMGIAGQH